MYDLYINVVDSELIRKTYFARLGLCFTHVIYWLFQVCSREDFNWRLGLWSRFTFKPIMFSSQALKMWDRLNGLQSVQLFFTVGCSAAVPEAWAWTTGCDWTGCSLKKYLWRNILTHISLTIRNCGTAFWLLNLSLLSFAVDANHAQGLSHQCKETQDLRKTVMQRNKSNCHCLRDSTSSMWGKQTTFHICSPKRTVLLRGTRDWWVVQA